MRPERIMRSDYALIPDDTRSAFWLYPAAGAKPLANHFSRKDVGQTASYL